MCSRGKSTDESWFLLQRPVRKNWKGFSHQAARPEPYHYCRPSLQSRASFAELFCFLSGQSCQVCIQYWSGLTSDIWSQLKWTNLLFFRYFLTLCGEDTDFCPNGIFFSVCVRTCVNESFKDIWKSHWPYQAAKKLSHAARVGTQFWCRNTVCFGYWFFRQCLRSCCDLGAFFLE